MAIPNPNIADRHNQSFYTGPIGNGTVLTGPVTAYDGDGNQATVAAVATDPATTMALANSLRAALLQLGLVVPA